MFGGLVDPEKLALDYLNKADLNKDGKPDKPQALKLAADFKKATDDFKDAADWQVVQKAAGLIQEGAAGAFASASDEAALLQQAIAKQDFAKVFEAFDRLCKDQHLKQHLGRCIAGAVQLSGALDQKKLALALGDVKVCVADIQEYVKPMTEPKPADKPKKK